MDGRTGEGGGTEGWDCESGWEGEDSMKNFIIADNFNIINTQGIRFVEKIDRTGSSFGGDWFNLRVTYKGSELTYSYKDKKDRDAQFDALKKMMLQVLDMRTFNDLKQCEATAPRLDHLHGALRCVLPNGHAEAHCFAEKL